MYFPKDWEIANDEWEEVSPHGSWVYLNPWWCSNCSLRTKWLASCLMMRQKNKTNVIGCMMLYSLLSHQQANVLIMIITRYVTRIIFTSKLSVLACQHLQISIKHSVQLRLMGRYRTNTYGDLMMALEGIGWCFNDGDFWPTNCPVVKTKKLFTLCHLSLHIPLRQTKAIITARSHHLNLLVVIELSPSCLKSAFFSSRHSNKLKHVYIIWGF